MKFKEIIFILKLYKISICIFLAFYDKVIMVKLKLKKRANILFKSFNYIILYFMISAINY